MRGLLLLAGLALLFLSLSPRPAQAYPQWQFSSGTARCNQCHFSPAGGGLITGYGRDAIGDDLSTWSGNGAFLHGAIDLPKSIALGFDGRYAFMSHDAGENSGAKKLAFPMQADGEAHIGFTESISLQVAVGYRGQARNADEPIGNGGALPASGNRFISREHYLMWRPSALGPYLRAGRFFAPYGLRLAEHYTYIRRDMGFNTLEESYGISGGIVKDDWETHITAFAPDFLRSLGGTESGLAAMLELRVADGTALGLQTRLGFKTDAYRYAGGAFGKKYLEGSNLLLQTEINVVHWAFPGGKVSQEQLVGYVGATYFPGKGFWITPFFERSQTNIKVKDSATNATGVQANWYPYPHFEIVGLTRLQLPAGGDSALTSMVFIHYFL